DRTLLIEHPLRPEYKLASEAKPTERTRDVYRFEVKLPAGKSESLEVNEERDLTQTVAVTNYDTHHIKILIQQPTVYESVKNALRQAVALRDKWAATQRELAAVNNQLNQINADQDRMRKTIKELPPTAEAYKRLLTKFDAQETEIEKLQARQKQ